jgi:nitrogen regulatory protein P-II 1
VQGMTVTEVRGFGRQGGHTETYRGARVPIDLHPKTKLELVVDDADVDGSCRRDRLGGHTEKIGDGKVWVTPVDTIARIRTGEFGGDAL